MDSRLVRQLLEISEKSKGIEIENKKLVEENSRYKDEIVGYKQKVEKTYNEKTEKLKEMVDKLQGNCEQLNQETERYRSKFTNYEQEIEPKYKEEIKRLKQEKERYHKELIECQEINIPRYKENIDNLKKELSCSYEKFNTENDKLNQFKTYGEKKINELETEIQNKIRMIKGLERAKRELEVKNEKLKKEASSSTSRRENVNNSVQLANYLNSLQEKIEKYVTTLKGSSVEVNNEKFLELFKRYNLKITKKTIGDKILMKSVLQRYVLEKVLEYADEYLDSRNQEKQIMDHTDNLLNLLDKFNGDHPLIKNDNDNNSNNSNNNNNNNNNNDNNKNNNKNKFTITAEIREQVYGLLGERGFSEVCNENRNGDGDSNGNELQPSKHPFVTLAEQKLNALMAEYRLIKDENRRKNTENMAGKLVKDIVRLFKFRLLINEPKFELYWFKPNDKIMPDFMKGTWDDDCLDDYVVDVCFFPLIGTKLNNNNDDGGDGLDFRKSKILSYARVCTSFVTNSQEEESPEEEERKAAPLKNISTNDVIISIFKKVIGGHRSTNQQNDQQRSQDQNNDNSSSTSASMVPSSSSSDDLNDKKIQNPNEQAKNDDNDNVQSEHLDDDSPPPPPPPSNDQQTIQDSINEHDDTDKILSIDLNDANNNNVDDSNDDEQKNDIQESNDNLGNIVINEEHIANQSYIGNDDKESESSDDSLSEYRDLDDDDLEEEEDDDSSDNLDNDYDEVGSNESQIF